MNIKEKTYSTNLSNLRAHDHLRWLPIAALQPGMRTARRVFTTTRGVMDFNLPAHTELSETLINQLVCRGVSCIAVEHQNPPSEAEYADILKNYNARLLMIFGADRPEDVKPSCKPLFDALQLTGPAL